MDTDPCPDCGRRVADEGDPLLDGANCFAAALPNDTGAVLECRTIALARAREERDAANDHDTKFKIMIGALRDSVEAEQESAGERDAALLGVVRLREALEKIRGLAPHTDEGEGLRRVCVNALRFTPGAKETAFHGQILDALEVCVFELSIHERTESGDRLPSVTEALKTARGVLKEAGRG